VSAPDNRAGLSPLDRSLFFGAVCWCLGLVSFGVGVAVETQRHIRSGVPEHHSPEYAGGSYYYLRWDPQTGTRQRVEITREQYEAFHARTPSVWFWLLGMALWGLAGSLLYRGFRDGQSNRGRSANQCCTDPEPSQPERRPQ